MSVAALMLFAASIAGGRVDDLLRAELERRFPAVQRWEIRSFDDVVSHPTSTPAVDSETVVVRVGARSAVRTGKRLRWFAVNGFQNVVSVKKGVRAGEALDASAGLLEERDVVAAQCEPLTDVAALDGMRTRRALHANEIICAEAIEPRPTVARGDTVTVRYVGERVELLTKGIARADGNLGDMLTVQSAKSADSFAARVSGAREVTVHE
jgi:flagella basal body P-ring formation protein FlgA